MDYKWTSRGGKNYTQAQSIFFIWQHWSKLIRSTSCCEPTACQEFAWAADLTQAESAPPARRVSVFLITFADYQRARGSVLNVNLTLWMC